MNVLHKSTMMMTNGGSGVARGHGGHLSTGAGLGAYF